MSPRTGRFEKLLKAWSLRFYLRKGTPQCGQAVGLRAGRARERSGLGRKGWGKEKRCWDKEEPSGESPTWPLSLGHSGVRPGRPR